MALWLRCRRTQLLQSCSLRHGLQRRLLCGLHHLSYFSMPGMAGGALTGSHVPSFPLHQGCKWGEGCSDLWDLFPSSFLPSCFTISTHRFFWLLRVREDTILQELGQLIFGPEMRSVGGALVILRPEPGFS